MKVLRSLLILPLWLLCSISQAAIDVHTYIPKQAFQYFDIIKKEQEYLLPGFEYPYYFAGLIEHESCIHLAHKRCWSPSSKLNTKRELGVGVFQLTKAYNEDGSIRFDIISDLKRSHMRELKELSWTNVEQRPDLQIRAGILLSKQNYKALYMVTDSYQRLAMADAAYNGGLGSVRKRRQICGLKQNCNPNIWFGHLDKTPVKSTKALYAGRSAETINTHHVVDVLTIRMPKYRRYFN